MSAISCPRRRALIPRASSGQTPVKLSLDMINAAVFFYPPTIELQHIWTTTECTTNRFFFVDKALSLCGMLIHRVNIINMEATLESKEFSQFRKKLKKTQKQMAELLGTSLKAIHSYEQGWRSIPTHVERQLYFLLSRSRDSQSGRKSCWAIKKCPPDQKKQCPAWEFRSGKLCWFINGTICEGTPHKNWREKMEICRTCEVLTSML